jgi:hypothetical protein
MKSLSSTHGRAQDISILKFMKSASQGWPAQLTEKNFTS